jgi:chemotaxis protein MotB
MAASCVSPEAHRRVVGEKEALQAQQAAMLESQKVLAVENERLHALVDDLKGRAADANWIAEQKLKINELLEKYGKGGTSTVEGVDVLRTSEGVVFRVAGGVLFAPGRNDLSEQGKKTLTELLSSLQGKRLRVEGHTDDTPITRSQWGTNLRLSVERAMVVAEFLIHSGGLKAENIGVSGYGEYRPTGPGTDDAARQQNRRVEILMLDG